MPGGGHFSPVYAYDLLTLISTLKADPRVDASRIDIFANSMGGAAGKRVTYITYPGDDHQFTANRAAILRNATAFFAAHL